MYTCGVEDGSYIHEIVFGDDFIPYGIEGHRVRDSFRHGAHSGRHVCMYVCMYECMNVSLM